MMTLRELREQIKDKTEKNKRVPSWKQLKGSGVEVIAEHEISDARIMAYENGYVVYQTLEKVTVFPFPGYEEFTYGSVLEKEDLTGMETISADEFENAPWYLRLYLEGEERLAANSDHRYRNNTMSFSAAGEDWDILINPGENNSAEDIVIRKETSKELACCLKCLTKTQQDIMISFFFDGNTYMEISLKTGNSKQNVRERIEKSLHRIRKRIGVQDPQSSFQTTTFSKKRKNKGNF